jgi:hypothetical protein
MTECDVVLVTFPNHPVRWQCFLHTWERLQARLRASRHMLRYVCSSESERDPERPWCGDELTRFCAERAIPLSWRTEPASLGGGMNAAIRAARSDVLFVVQDDFELLHDLDLSPGIEALLAHREIDLIRYSWPPANFGWRFCGDVAGWRRFDLAANWPYGDEPHLQRRDFTDRHGWYAEGVGHASEGRMLHKLIADKAVICAADQPYFGHTGSVSAVPANRDPRGSHR